MIKVILFDLGDVLINNSFDSVLQEIANNLGISFEELKKMNEIYKKEMLVGELSVSGFNILLKEKLKLNLAPEEIDDIWEKSYEKVRTVNEELYDFAKRLKKKYIVGMISNIYDLTEKQDRERGIFDIFKPCILSCKVGLAKPGKEIFELALRELNLKAEECVFIDNREGHLVEPKQLGFKTILFENNDKTIEELEFLINSR